MTNVYNNVLIFTCRKTQEQIGRHDPRSFTGHDCSQARAGVYGSQRENPQI